MVTAPTSPGQRRVFHGSFVHALSNRKLEYLVDTLLAVDESGVIVFIQRDVRSEDIAGLLEQQQNGWKQVEVTALKRGEFIIPGLIDTHTHAPQYPNLGRGQQYQLLDWLSNLTFPTEAKFSDPIYAQRTYESVASRNIAAGTTTCCWYATLHLDATKQLADIVHRKGQRAFVGKCNMDRNSAPDYVEKTASKSIEDTKEFIAYVRKECCSPRFSASTSDDPTSPRVGSSSRSRTASSGSGSGSHDRRRKSGSNGRHRSSTSGSSGAASVALSVTQRAYYSTALVQPILTPRFAISCSDALMASLQAMVSKDPSLHIQTHLAENPAEIEFTKQLFPFTDSYTQVYDHFGLLTEKTILAHCVHLEEDEMQLIKRQRSGISHCPTSNLNLRSGCSPVAELLDRGIKVGLGTDVSGGFGLGILSALREASVVSKVFGFQEHAKIEADKSRGRSLTPKKQSNGSALPPVEADAEAERTIDAPARALSAPDKFAGKHLPLETLFFLATLGGAEVCELQDVVGNFKVGKEFDALLVRTGQKELDFQGDLFEDQPNPALFVEPQDPLEAIFEKFLFAGDDRNIASVFVRGRVIGGAAPLGQ